MKTWTKIILACLILFSFFKCSFQKRLHRKGYYIEWLTHHSSKQKNDFKSSEIISPKPIQAFKSSHHDDVFLNSSLQASTSNHSNIIRSIKSFLSKTQPDTCGDILTLKNGDEYVVKVLEITEKEIKYKRCDNINGPVYSIAKSKVYMIKYVNGTNEHILSDEPDYDYSKANVKEPNELPPHYNNAYVWFALTLLFGIFGLIGALFASKKALTEIKSKPEVYTGKSEMEFIFNFSYALLIAFVVFAFILGLIFIGFFDQLAVFFISISIALLFFLIWLRVSMKQSGLL